ncbi:EspA/EspE family type VII secretion system effector [Mycolicibacterium sp. 120266]|uniref:EspA/EspE family type VII secretion system effector n=1 Tax=Mycolicibacterium sp. 120266 TaxID=3090601 RepID=UPI00299E09CF|nr:EspA/EspE family type VII secretion system effector [Mycolicibacterium sp. 120266]MDX1873424.1 EspA/EspE family type VII secretion system effector [Mycolicibacterium sp. 120266]
MSKRPSPPAPARAAERTEDLLEAASSAILLGGQRLLAQMLQTLGEGTPEDGEAFGMAGKQFRAVGTELGAAVPAGDWTGTGSDAYAQQNADQRGRTGSIADTDHEVHRVLAGEAYQVTFHRKQIVELYNWLGELSRYTQWLELVPRYGEAAKVVVEFAAVQTALTSAQCELKNMRAEAAANAMRLRDLVGRYQAIAATARLPEGEFEGGPEPASPVHGEADFDGMGGRLGAPAPLRSAGGLARVGTDGPFAAEGSDLGPEALEDTGDNRAAAGTEAQRDQPNPAAGLAGLVGVAGVVPALAAAVTAPLTALVAPAGGAVAAVVGAVAQGAAASQEPETAGDDEGEPAGPAGPDSAVPQQVIDPAAEDSGTGGSGTATVNADDTRVPDAAARPSAMGR